MTRSAPASRRRPDRARVEPSSRRRQLLEVAARLLTDEGLDSVQVTAVAARARVSRPLVYRLFPTRQALVVALLEDFAEVLDAKFQRAILAQLPSTLEEITGAFVEACCEAIEERGAGAWHLLGARASDPEIARVGREIQERVVGPWQARIAELTGLPPRRAAMLSRVIVAAGYTMLDGWLEKRVFRAEAVRDTTRTVSALLREFTESGSAPKRS